MNQYRVRLTLYEFSRPHAFASREYDVQAASLATAAGRAARRLGSRETRAGIHVELTARDVDPWPSPVRALGGQSEGVEK